MCIFYPNCMPVAYFAKWRFVIIFSSAHNTEETREWGFDLFRVSPSCRINWH